MSSFMRDQKIDMAFSRHELLSLDIVLISHSMRKANFPVGKLGDSIEMIFYGIERHFI